MARTRTIADLEVMLRANTASLQKSLDDVKRKVQDSGKAITDVGRNTRQDLEQTRESIIMMGDQIGVHMNRELSRFIAKNEMVAKAVGAAFSTIAVVALIQVVVEAGEKLADFIKKNDEAAEKSREAWRSIGRSMQSTNDDLEISNLKLQDAIAKLQGGPPRNGLQIAILEASRAADELGEKLDADLEKIQANLKADQGAGLLNYVEQIAGNKGDLSGVQAQAKGFQSKLEAIQDNDKLSPEQRLQALAAAADLEHRIARQRVKDAQQVLDQWDAMRREEDPAGGLQDKAQRDVLAAWQKYSASLAPMARLASGTVEHADLQAEFSALGGNNPPAQRSASQAAAPKSLREALRLTMGTEPTSAIAAMRDRMTASQFDLDNGGALFSGTVSAEMAKTLDKFDQVWAKTAPAVTVAERMPTAFESLRASVSDLADEFSSTGAQLSQLFGRSLATVNDALVTEMTTPHALLQGRNLWGGVGHGIFTGIARTGLEHAEGGVMKALGLGHKADGSQAAPFWVRDADKKGGGMGGNASSGLLKWANSNDWLGKHFGGLFGEGGMLDGGDSGSGGGLVGGIAKFFGGLFGGGHALGGDVVGGIPINVGELGPETWVPPANGTIIPASAHRSSPSIHIDARGASDPAAIEASVHRAMAGYLPHVGAMAVAAQRDNNRRTPSARR